MIAMECANINGSGVEGICHCIDRVVFGAPVVDHILTAAYGMIWVRTFAKGTLSLTDSHCAMCIFSSVPRPFDINRIPRHATVHEDSLASNINALIAVDRRNYRIDN